MRSEIRRFAFIALIIVVASIIFPVGDWLELALQYQPYHVDDLIVAIFAVSFVMMFFLWRGWRDLRRESSERAREAGERAAIVKVLEERGKIDAQLSQMTSFLHACFELEEASKIISHFAQQFFPDYTGGLYVFRSSRNLLEAVVGWGGDDGSDPMFTPQQCWALRQGQLYAVSDPQHSIICSHIHHTRPYTCLPMVAQGEVLALLHVCPKQESVSNGILRDGHYALMRVFTEHIALALSNLKLRDTLRQQSIRDPLTGLFNRRYLEETLATEIERAKRASGPFSILMLDLDHFKLFNDTHGHEAGDAVLQAVGRFLQQHIRGGDIACRYGGEEFTLLLPGIALAAGQQRAEQLCEGIRVLNVDFKNQMLGPLTLSIGIATYPNHGESGDLVVQAADVALYEAKSKGRDQVIVAV
jgi:diguanylate cyclase (GGDEF)-like protein